MRSYIVRLTVPWNGSYDEERKAISRAVKADPAVESGEASVESDAGDTILILLAAESQDEVAPLLTRLCEIPGVLSARFSG